MESTASSFIKKGVFGDQIRMSVITVEGKKVYVNGTRQRQDFILYEPNVILKNWKRKNNDTLELSDCFAVDFTYYDKIIIGIGIDDQFEVLDEVIQEIERAKVPYVILPTLDAIAEYNNDVIAENLHVIGLFHI